MVVIILLIALLCFVFLSFSARRGVKAESEDTNALLYKEAGARIEQQSKAGEIDSQQAEMLLAEAKTQLANSIAVQDVSLSHHNGWLRWLPLVGVPAIAVVVYLAIGASDELDIRDQMASINQESSPEQIAALGKTINNLLASQPDKHGYRVVSARISQELGDMPGAVAQYRALRDAYPNDASVQLDYTQMLFTASNGQLTPELAQAYKRVIELEPDNLSALTMLGMVAMQANDPDEAAKHWRKAVSLMPQGQERDLIASGLARAEAMAASSKPVSGQSVVSVSVSLNGLEATANRYLFLYAALAHGMPAPLAIKRFEPGQSVPDVIKLTDADYMMPSHKLLPGQQVRVIARLSDSANVMDQTNDLVVEVPVTTKQGDVAVQLLINSQ